MRVVSDTSVISNLAIIERLELLRQRYAKIVIPPAVQIELAALSHEAGKCRVSASIRDGWISVEKPKAAPPSVSLDKGELAALALCLEPKANLLLMDERKGRSIARNLGIPVSGVLGEFLHAKKLGRIPMLKEEIARLKIEARFFVSTEIEAFLLSEAGE